MQSTFRTTETYWIFHSKKRWKLSEKSSSCIDQRPGQKMYNLAAVKMNSRACQSQTRLRKRCFSNKVSSDHLTFALYHCIPLFSFSGCKESLFFCLEHLVDAWFQSETPPRKKGESTTRSWKNRALKNRSPASERSSTGTSYRATHRGWMHPIWVNMCKLAKCTNFFG